MVDFHIDFFYFLVPISLKYLPESSLLRAVVDFLIEAGKKGNAVIILDIIMLLYKTETLYYVLHFSNIKKSKLKELLKMKQCYWWASLIRKVQVIKTDISEFFKCKIHSVFFIKFHWCFQGWHLHKGLVFLQCLLADFLIERSNYKTRLIGHVQMDAIFCIVLVPIILKPNSKHLL